MERALVKSSNIRSIGYDQTGNLLEIEFLDFAVYQYLDVGVDVYHGIMRAASKGSYLNDVVKGRYRYRRVS